MIRMRAGGVYPAGFRLTILVQVSESSSTPKGSAASGQALSSDLVPDRNSGAETKGDKPTWIAFTSRYFGRTAPICGPNLLFWGMAALAFRNGPEAVGARKSGLLRSVETNSISDRPSSALFDSKR